MKRLIDKAGWALAGALGLALVLVAARVIQAGPLDPPGPVGSTMKTIGDLVPSWHQTLASSGCGSPRWSCVMGGGAVLDNETGLVWEKTPAQGENPVSWSDAVKFCGTNGTGGRYGWRLPTNEELSSLLDPTGFGVIAGSPFTGISATLGYWSSTTAPGTGFNALATGFGGAPGGSVYKDEAADFTFWCVRGQPSFDAPAPNDAAAWSKVLSAAGAVDSCHSPRFTCVLGNAGVLDHETGLVWERVPSANGNTWFGAVEGCQKAVGGRLGWRLPSNVELRSLSVQIGNVYVLPPGHPFTAPGLVYWTGTTASADATRAEVITPLNFEYVSNDVKASAVWPRWCVRGPGSDGG